METRPYTPDDYAMVEGWWTAHGWTPVLEKVLPPTGLIAEADGVCVAAAWLYFADAPMAWLEWCVANPDSKGKTLHRGIAMVLTELLEIADERGVVATFSSSEHAGLIRVYQGLGFTVTDKGATTMIRANGG